MPIDQAIHRQSTIVVCPGCGITVRISDTFLLAYAARFNCIVAEEDRARLAQACRYREKESEGLRGAIGELIARTGQCTCADLSETVTAKLFRP